MRPETQATQSARRVALTAFFDRSVRRHKVRTVDRNSFRGSCPRRGDRQRRQFRSSVTRNNDVCGIGRGVCEAQRRKGFWAALSPARCLVLRPKESCGPARVPHTNAATSAHSSLEKEDLFVPTAFAEPNRPQPKGLKAARLEPGSKRDCAEFRTVEPADFGNQRRSEGHSSQGQAEAECLPEQVQEGPRLPRPEERQSTAKGEYAGPSSCIAEPGPAE